LSENDLSC